MSKLFATILELGGSAFDEFKDRHVELGPKYVWFSTIEANSLEEAEVMESVTKWPKECWELEKDGWNLNDCQVVPIGRAKERHSMKTWDHQKTIRYLNSNRGMVLGYRPCEKMKNADTIIRPKYMQDSGQGFTLGSILNQKEEDNA